MNNLHSLVFPSENSYGTKMDNGSQFSGILGLLQNQVPMYWPKDISDKSRA